MIIKSINANKYPEYMCRDFEDINLIHSKGNTKGKTTFVRILLHSLGYEIPGVGKFVIKDVLTDIVIEKNDIEYRIKREKNIATLEYLNEKILFRLPEEVHKIHSIIFGLDNIDVLKNILGCYYVDQTSGIKVVNRGIIIDSISFNIDSLIAGLCEIDINDLNTQISKEEQSLDIFKKYKTINVLKEELGVNKEDKVFESDTDIKINIELSSLKKEKNELVEQLHLLENIISKNKNFENFLDSFRINIKHNDEVFPLTSDKIDFHSINEEQIKRNIKFLKLEIAIINKDISINKSKIKKVSRLIDADDYDKIIRENLANIEINTSSIDCMISETDSVLKKLRKKRKKILSE
ncbi:MAG: hypothetical protein R3Y13_05865 [bacterium]